MKIIVKPNSSKNKIVTGLRSKVKVVKID